MKKHIDSLREAYFNDDLSTDQKKQFEMHLQSCERCNKILESDDRFEKTLSSLSQIDPPVELSERIMDSIFELDVASVQKSKNVFVHEKNTIHTLKSFFINILEVYMSLSVKMASMFVGGLVLGGLIMYLIVHKPADQDQSLASSGSSPTSQTTGTASSSVYTDVIGNTSGFIIENARLADKKDQQTITVYDVAKIAEGKSSLILIKGTGNDPSVKTMLLLQIPKFAEGSSVEFTGDAKEAQFYVVGNVNGKQSINETGLISGNMRFISKVPSTTSISGYMGELKEGMGDIEIVISNINAPGLSIDRSRKFVARYNLPIVTFSQWASLNVTL